VYSLMYQLSTCLRDGWGAGVELVGGAMGRERGWALGGHTLLPVLYCSSVVTRT
jgi:hypothetical protein